MPEEVRAKVSQNGRIVIPASFREALGINEGDEVVMRLDDKELRISTKRLRLQRAQERARRYVKPGISLADELIAERRGEAKRE
jgi:AbrB family looped-hinge helix DNA binding protein